jgi:hypothetical protein
MTTGPALALGALLNARCQRPSQSRRAGLRAALRCATVLVKAPVGTGATGLAGTGKSALARPGTFKFGVPARACSSERESLTMTLRLPVA